MVKKINENKESQKYFEFTENDLYLKVPSNSLEVKKAISILTAYNNLLNEVIDVVGMGEEGKKDIKEEVKTITPEIKKVSDEDFINKGKCPKCQSKLKNSTKKQGNLLISVIKCKKNKKFRSKCDFIKESSFNI